MYNSFALFNTHWYYTSSSIVVVFDNNAILLLNVLSVFLWRLDTNILPAKLEYNGLTVAKSAHMFAANIFNSIVVIFGYKLGTTFCATNIAFNNSFSFGYIKVLILFVILSNSTGSRTPLRLVTYYTLAKSIK